jgi:hypothetical protein
MAEEIQIQCVKTTGLSNRWDRVSHVGGVTPKAWKVTQEEAISLIDRGVWKFWVELSGHSVRVIVAAGRYGDPYLKTAADSGEMNSLLRLPEFPR